MHSEGLSLDQAPPYSAPMRFFLTAPLFLILAGIMVAVYDPALIFERYSPIAVALVHLVTLGFMTMVMVGAMQQMLPVLAGVQFPKAGLFATVIHILMIVGTLTLAQAFLTSEPMWFLYAGASLGLGCGLYVLITLYVLFKADFGGATLMAMRFSHITFLIALLLGIHILVGYGHTGLGIHHLFFVNLHILFAFMGWVFVLIMGVAFRVVPMFWVAEEFPKFVQNVLAPGVPITLALYIGGFGLNQTVLADSPLDLSLLIMLFSFMTVTFSIATVQRLRDRKRKVTDVIVWFWYLSMATLVIGTALMVCAPLIATPLDTVMGIVLGYGFAVTLIIGMLYKIVAFLTWFHLSAKGYFDMPTVREIIPIRNLKLHFFLHGLTILLLMLAGFVPELAKVTGTLIVLSGGILFYNLLKGPITYRRVLNGPAPFAAAQ